MNETIDRSAEKAQTLIDNSANQPNRAPCIAIVVPCYNESEVIEMSTHILWERLEFLAQSDLITTESSILLVDDGSSDDTWAKIEKLVHHYSSQSPDKLSVHGIKFAHNRGHQFAVFAGIMEAREAGYDVSISIDADLQDDPLAIDDMIHEYMKGAEIVYGVRNNRDTDTAFKRGTAKLFYSLMEKLGAHTIPNHADFRLTGRRAMDALSQYDETNLFLRGITAQLGFTTACVYYKRAERQAGESKYPLHKMISFAINGITSFSVQPIRIISWIGILSFVVGIGMIIYTIVAVALGDTVTGWASLMSSLWLLGGAILLGIGVVGEYIAKIYVEVKQRPRYFVEKRI